MAVQGAAYDVVDQRQPARDQIVQRPPVTRLRCRDGGTPLPPVHTDVAHPLCAHSLSDRTFGLPDADATSAAIRVGGDGTWRGTAGVRDIRTGAPAPENGRFRAGSVTKVVTASIVLQLAAEGRIDLDGTVQRYLPGLLTREFQPITVLELLNYTSGLRSGASLGDTVEEGYPHRFETLAPRQVVAASVAKGPAYAPGTRQDYSRSRRPGRRARGPGEGGSTRLGPGSPGGPDLPSLTSSRAG
jgi:hypothetical protein